MTTPDGTQIGGPMFSTHTENTDMIACCLASDEYRQNAAACQERVESRTVIAWEKDEGICYEDTYETTIQSAGGDDGGLSIEIASEEVLVSRMALYETD